MQQSQTHAAALAYIGRGIAIFPVLAANTYKAPATKNGFLDATLDRAVVEEWWAQWPDGNIGIATGSKAGFWVLDIDGEQGAATLAALVEKHGPLPETPEQTTARGRHICFAWDPARPIKNRVGVPGLGIDVRGEGGYIVGAPSRHATGIQYLWHPDRRPSKMDFAPAPDWLLTMVEKKPPELRLVRSSDDRGPANRPRTAPPTTGKLITPWGEAILREECAKIRAAQPGAQETTLNGCAFNIGTVVGAGEIAESIARTELISAGMAIARDWTLQDVADKVERAIQAGKLQPREKPALPPRPAPSPAPTSGVTERDVRAVMAKAAEPADDEPFKIQLRGGGLSEEASLGERALIRAGHPIYQRGRMLVRPVVEDVDAAHGRRTRVAQLVQIERYALVDYLCRSATFTRFDGRTGAEKQVNPTLELASVILARQGAWAFPSIAGVITTPTLRPDGSLLVEAGYDPSTRLLLVDPPRLPPIPDRPSKADAAAALERLKYLLSEFPLSTAESASVALSALITPVVRAAFPVAPMHVMSAPTPGTGKSFLLDVVAAIAIGRLMPVMAAGRDEAETEKRLASALLAGQPLISLDNVNGDLGGDALNQAVERPVIDIRPLGRSERITVEARSTLFATGNNIRLIGDMTRRVIVATLDASVERPELRRFEGNPVKTVLSDRGRYIADALLVCRAYIVAGKPDAAPRLGSFEGWSDLVRSALLWLGQADPVATMEVAREEDPYLTNMRAVFGALRAVVGLDSPKTTAEMISMAEEVVLGDFVRPELRDALLMVAGERNGRLNPRLLGAWLRRHKGRVDTGVRLEARNGSRAQWWLSAVSAVAAVSSNSEK